MLTKRSRARLLQFDKFVSTLPSAHRVWGNGFRVCLSTVVDLAELLVTYVEQLNQDPSFAALHTVGALVAVLDQKVWSFFLSELKY